MRPSKKPWPSYLPACAAEVTKEQPSASVANPRRYPNGVAVLVSDGKGCGSSAGSIGA